MNAFPPPSAPLVPAPHATPTEPTVLVLPGYLGSGPGHWQSHWEARWPELRRVEQERWDAPEPDAWVARLEEEVRQQRRVILVAHSLGCALVSHWARRGAVERVASALLVAPPDLERPGRPAALAPFAPVPRARLPFPAWVVASTNDPYAAIASARRLATAWGARFLDAGPLGHINVDSGHGAWPEGAQLLEQLRPRLARARPEGSGAADATRPALAGCARSTR